MNRNEKEVKELTSSRAGEQVLPDSLCNTSCSVCAVYGQIALTNLNS